MLPRKTYSASRCDSGSLGSKVAKTPSRHPEEGIYIGDGALQLGLRHEEIEALKQRREQLLHDVDAGKLATF